jgi:alpha-tubulin suppressor-like RCC1 family protein
MQVRQVKQISCGTTHIGLVTNDGKCYTWGSGENGMLGHGHRQSINSPQCVAAFDGMVCVQISCSAYHTAVIAEKVSKIQYVRIPAAHLISPDRSAAGTRSSSTLNGRVAYVTIYFV